MNENLAITVYEKDTSNKEYGVTMCKQFFKKTQKYLVFSPIPIFNKFAHLLKEFLSVTFKVSYSKRAFLDILDSLTCKILEYEKYLTWAKNCLVFFQLSWLKLEIKNKIIS